MSTGPNSDKKFKPFSKDELRGFLGSVITRIIPNIFGTVQEAKEPEKDKSIIFSKSDHVPKAAPTVPEQTPRRDNPPPPLAVTHEPKPPLTPEQKKAFDNPQIFKHGGRDQDNGSNHLPQ